MNGRLTTPPRFKQFALACCLVALVSQQRVAPAQSPDRAAAMRPRNMATLKVADSRGRVKTVQTALPPVRLAQRSASEANNGQPPRAPGLGWLIPAQRGQRNSNSQTAPNLTPAPEEVLPAPADEVHIPLAQPEDAGKIEVTGSGNRVSLVVREASLNSVLNMLAEHTGLNIVLTDATNAQVTITLRDVRLEDALDAILSITGNSWTRKNNIIFITNISNAGPLSTGVQGTEMRIFELDYASAVDVSEAVTALLSPLGRSFINQIDKADNHKTKEIVVVEDLPHVVRQIESYIRQIDTPPRQVLIQAHILKIDLKRTDLHGVNLNRLFSLLGHHIQLQTLGFATSSHSPAFFGSFDGNHMGALIECLQSVNDAKTLAEPKVLCLNGQEASFQVGKKLGYKIISTSQTSTLQSINFLNVGVILHVTPRISHDNQVLMRVKPEVSDGSVDQTSGLPSSNTTDVETDVLLPDGRGIVIGGLIQESDTADIAKIPGLGDLWLIGRLFQRRNIVRERAEVIIFLVPRIVPYEPDYQRLTACEVARAQTPLLGEQFARQQRRGEPQLYDAVESPLGFQPRSLKQPSRPPTWHAMHQAPAAFSTPHQRREEIPGEPIIAPSLPQRQSPSQAAGGANPSLQLKPPGNATPSSRKNNTSWLDRAKKGKLFR